MKLDNVKLVRVPNTPHNLALLNTQLAKMIGRPVGEVETPTQGRGQNTTQYMNRYCVVNQEHACFKLVAFYAMIETDVNGASFIQVTGDLELIDNRYGRMVMQYISSRAASAWRIGARLLTKDIERQEVTHLIALDFLPVQ